jgi:hypothetical protein
MTGDKSPPEVSSIDRLAIETTASACSTGIWEGIICKTTFKFLSDFGKACNGWVGVVFLNVIARNLKPAKTSSNCSSEQGGCQMLLMLQTLVEIKVSVSFLVRHSYELKCIGIKTDLDDLHANETGTSWCRHIKKKQTNLIVHYNHGKYIYIKFAG